MIGFNTTAGVQVVGTSSTDATDRADRGNLIGTDAGTDNRGQRHRRADLQRGGQHDRRHDRRHELGGGQRDRFQQDAGVAILSGTGNAINANTYDGTNGSLQTPSVAASDIGVGVGANGNLQPPQVLSASLSPDGSTAGAGALGRREHVDGAGCVPLQCGPAEPSSAS